MLRFPKYSRLRPTPPVVCETKLRVDWCTVGGTAVRSPALTANGIMMPHHVCCFCVGKLAPQRFPTHGAAVTVASSCMHRTDKLRLHSHHYAAQSFEFSLMPTGYTWGEHPQIVHHSYSAWCHCALMPLAPRRCCRGPASPWHLAGAPPRQHRAAAPLPHSRNALASTGSLWCFGAHGLTVVL